VGGLLSGLIDAVLQGAFRPVQIGTEALLWSVSLSVAAAVAWVPSHWAVRGAAGGITYGLVRGGLAVGLAVSTRPWGQVLGSEVVGGLVGGLLLAYLWRSQEDASMEVS